VFSYSPAAECYTCKVRLCSITNSLLHVCDAVNSHRGKYVEEFFGKSKTKVIREFEEMLEKGSQWIVCHFKSSR